MKNHVWIRVVLTILILGIVAFLGYKIVDGIKKSTPVDEEMPLADYFELKNKDEIIVFYNNVKNSDMTVRVEDNVYYLPLDQVKAYFNNRFYYEPSEETLYYTTEKNVIKVNPGTTSYYEGNENKECGYKILLDRDQMYIAINFVEMFTNIGHTEYIEPNRLMIYDAFAISEERVEVKSDTEIRYTPSIKSLIVDRAIENAKLVYLDQSEAVTDIENWQDDWVYVQTLEGVKGYIKKKTVGESFEIETKYVNNKDYSEPKYKHVFYDKGDIVMLWHGVYSSSSNSKITNILTTSTGVNVMSPTWFKVKSEDGSISDDLADKSYVSQCHDAGVQVWGLFSNFEDENISTTKLLTTAASRENFENQVILMALNYDLDGVNLDFEGVLPEAREAFVQLVRELAIKCHDNKLILSVDNYVPTEYTYTYNRNEQKNYADYVVIMGYDEHYAGSDEGSVASIGFVKDGVKDTIDQGVPADQIVLGMPFYTRVWEETPKTDEEIDTVEAASEDYRPYTLKSEAVSMTEARTRAENNGAEIRWIDKYGQNYCEYMVGEKTIKIWIEDAKSLEEKLKVAKDNKLAGGAFWAAGLETADVWDVIGNYFN